MRFILLLGATALLACGCVTVERDEPRAPQPDRVVGIEKKCDFVLPSDLSIRTLTGWDAACSQTDFVGIRVYNVRKELKIRTDAGTTYRIEYGAEHDVWLGMEWPPK